MLPDWIMRRVEQADKLSAQARLAALAGDEALATQLRDAHEAIYEQIEAELQARESAGQPATPALRIAPPGDRLDTLPDATPTHAP